MKIPEHIIEQVRVSSDIVDVVGEAVRLKKAGRNYLGLCPFHGEKTPSFNVQQERGIYKCFGCGKGGNVFTFMMEYYSLSFVEAVRTLAQKAGITIAEDTETDDGKSSQYDAAYNALLTAARFYYSKLQKPEGKIGVDYFKKRGFDPELVKEFALGFAPDAWEETSNELKKQGFSIQAMEDAGLIIKRDDGTGYDRFRGRVMFPIHDQIGRIVGFGARRMNEDPKQPKYINSPQSLVYDKSRVLYGLFQGKQELRAQNSAILVEGYADVLTLHQAGFKNAVASSGTALTKEQLQLLHRYAKNLYIVYDADAAGISAAFRGLEIALEEGFEIKIVQLPKGDDPDSFVKNHGADAFKIYLRDAVSFLDFQADTFKNRGELETPAGMAESVRSLVRTISKVQDPLQRDFMIRSLAGKFGLNESLLYDELKKILSDKFLKQQYNQREQKSAQQNLLKDENPGEAQTGIEQKKQQEVLNPEEELLSSEKMLIDVAVRVRSERQFMINVLKLVPENFFTPFAKRLFEIIIKSEQENIDPLYHSDLTLNESNFLTDLVINREMSTETWIKFGQEALEENTKREIRDCIFQMRLYGIQQELSSLQNQSRTLSIDDQIDIMRKIQSLINQQEEVRREFAPPTFF
ncbi:MAG: DNA primase [Bacteroidota bacterium]